MSTETTVQPTTDAQLDEIHLIADTASRETHQKFKHMKGDWKVLFALKDPGIEGIIVVPFREENGMTPEPVTGLHVDCAYSFRRLKQKQMQVPAIEEGGEATTVTYGAPPLECELPMRMSELEYSLWALALQRMSFDLGASSEKFALSESLRRVLITLDMAETDDETWKFTDERLANVKLLIELERALVRYNSLDETRLVHSFLKGLDNAELVSELIAAFGKLNKGEWHKPDLFLEPVRNFESIEACIKLWEAKLTLLRQGLSVNTEHAHVLKALTDAGIDPQVIRSLTRNTKLLSVSTEDLIDMIETWELLDRPCRLDTFHELGGTLETWEAEEARLEKERKAEEARKAQEAARKREADLGAARVKREREAAKRAAEIDWARLMSLLLSEDVLAQMLAEMKDTDAIRLQAILVASIKDGARLYPSKKAPDLKDKKLRKEANALASMVKSGVSMGQARTMWRQLIAMEIFIKTGSGGIQLNPKSPTGLAGKVHARICKVANMGVLELPRVGYENDEVKL